MEKQYESPLKTKKYIFNLFLNFYFPNTVFFPTIQHGDPVTHTCIDSFFSRDCTPLLVTRHSSQCYTAGSHCQSIPKALVEQKQKQNQKKNRVTI